MVEAAMIVPIIIGTMILLIRLIVKLYTMVQENCLKHAVLLQEGDALSIADFIRNIDVLKGFIQ